MKVLKFGGTSVGSAERMQSVVNLINDVIFEFVLRNNPYSQQQEDCRDDAN